MPKYILHYFRANGRAAIARAILSYVKADWENTLYDYKDWPNYKKSGLAEFEQLPVLEVDGKKYCESNAINLYLGEIFNLLGKDAEENYQVNNLLMTYDDLLKLFIDVTMIKDEQKKIEEKNKASEKVKFFIIKFEKRYVELGKGKYFLGEKFTLADIYITCGFIEVIQNLCPKNFEIKEIAPNLAELIQRIKENELKEFFEKYNNIIQLI